jgi:hypothetical protein
MIPLSRISPGKAENKEKREGDEHENKGKENFNIDLIKACHNISLYMNVK